jgi:hypothetical protein
MSTPKKIAVWVKEFVVPDPENSRFCASECDHNAGAYCNLFSKELRGTYPDIKAKGWSYRDKDARCLACRRAKVSK